jgi:hypothetical protein
MLTKENCGCSELACNIVNSTFLSLDGFAALRAQMDSSEYKAEHFAAELARIADREIKESSEKAFEAFALKFGVDTKTLRMTNHELAS